MARKSQSPEAALNRILLCLGIVHLMSVGALAQIDSTGGEPVKRAYVVPYAHLDTQWGWTLQATIDTYLPNTLRANFSLFKKYPGYRFNFEGAYRYMLVKQYYPADYQTLKGYISSGRWNPAGAMLEGCDVNIPSPEAIVRQILYGNRFFQEEFGRTSMDLLLPDCFGFPFTLPTIALHCGLRGFSTQKFQNWGGFIPTPFSIGQWEGVDGSRIIAALRPGGYTTPWKIRVGDLEELGQQSGVYDVYDYFGVGDQGGAPADSDVASLMARIQQNSSSDIQVLCASSDQIFRDLSDIQMSALPVYKGELLMTRHGTGCYTAHADQKLLNRADELMANAAERASVVAELVNGFTYPADHIRENWISFLAHDFHDDISGTSIQEAYDEFSTPARTAALASLRDIRDAANRAVATALDTRGDGASVPVVVFNPAALDRHDVVDVTVVVPGPAPASVRVYDMNGVEVPSQVKEVSGGSFRILFTGDVPALGYAVFQVKNAAAPCKLPTGMHVSTGVLENARYRVTIDANGDPSGIFDKKAGRELLSGSSRFEVHNDQSSVWPAWELLYNDVTSSPRSFVNNSVQKMITDSGAARVTLRIFRSNEGSNYTHEYSLTADTSGYLLVNNAVNWQESSPTGSLLKVSFPLTVSNPLTTYDLGLGTIQRGVNQPSLYEVPAQQWADLTNPDKSYGVAVLTDCKYGWDKPSANTIRLSLIHTPGPTTMYYAGDRYVHTFAYGVFGHSGDWAAGNVVGAAERLNQPLVAFQTTAHAGAMGTAFRFLSLDPSQIAVMAVKKAEGDDRYIIRVRETSGKIWPSVTLAINARVISAREVDGMEREKGAVNSTQEGISFSIGPYQLRSFALTLAAPPGTREVNLSPGWGLVSLPVRTADSSVTSVFPGAVSQAISFGNCYAPVTSFTPGRGYWLMFETAKSCAVKGTRVNPADVPVTKGWNLIGTFDADVAAGSVTSSPEGIVVSDYYGYSGRYAPSATLCMGKGYWVKTSRAGVLHLPVGSGWGGGGTLVKSSGGGAAPVWIELTDAKGAAGMLQLAAPGVMNDAAELPPLPPDGIMDVRFVPGNVSEEPLGRKSVHEIQISGAAYPVKMKAGNLGGKTLRLRDPIEGRLVNVTLSEGKSVTVNIPISRLLLEEGDQLPLAYELSQNYPNPFNPVTVFRFALPEASRVSLEVYNVLGQKVASIVEGFYPAGYHQIEFNARDLASGTYFCRMQAGGFTGVKKIMVLR